ncbi:MAG: hypothetical protein AAGA58_20210 [Verrucomicrobiota bacterium]
MKASADRIAAADPKSADDVRRHPKPLIGYSDDLRDKNLKLRKFLYQNLYYHDNVRVPNTRGVNLIERVFRHFLENPDLLGARTQERIERDGKERTVCDYVSGMTDRYIQEAVEKYGL